MTEETKKIRKIECPKHGLTKAILLYRLQGKKEGPEDQVVCIECVAERMVQPVRRCSDLRGTKQASYV
jgi:hypothetical protein